MIDSRLLIKALSLKSASVSGVELKCRCPNTSHEDAGPSFGFNLETQFYNCFGCGFKGRGVMGLFLKLGFDLPDWVKSAGVSQEQTGKSVLKPKNEKSVIIRNSWLNFLTVNSEGAYRKLKVRGVTRETVKEFRIGYNDEHDILFFPCFDVKGNLTGWAERSDNWAYRYRVMPQGVSKGNLLYGDWRIKEGKRNQVCVVEGPVDCIKLWQWGYPAVALLGSDLLGGQKERLIDLADEVIIVPDMDKAGLKMRFAMIDNLRGKVKLSGVNLPMKDVGEASCTKKVVEESIAAKIYVR